MSSVLVIQLARMGDIVQAGPMLYALKHQGRARHVAVLVNKKFSSVCSLMPWIDDVHTLDFNEIGHYLLGDNADIEQAYAYLKRFYDRLSAHRFDRIVNITPHYTGIFSAFLAHCPGMRTTEDHGWPLYFRAVTRSWNTLPFHMADLYMRIAGLQPTQQYPGLIVDDDERHWAQSFLTCHACTEDDLIVGFHTGASAKEKQWPLDCFIRLGRLLLRDPRIKIILCGTDSSQDISSVLGRRCVSVLGRTTIRQLAALLMHTTVLVSNDTGPVHIAAGCGVKIITIHMGKETCFTTAPYTTEGFSVQPKLSCHPCEHPEQCAEMRCKDSIHPDVIASLVRLCCNGNGAESLNDLRAHGDSVVVYEPYRDPIGCLDFHPVTRMPLTFEAVCRCFMRYIWTETLQPQASSPHRDMKAYVGTLASAISDRYSDSLGSTADVRKLEQTLHRISALSDEGTAACSEIISHARHAARHYRELKRLAAACERVDHAIAASGTTTPPVQPLVHQYFAEKETCKENGIAALAADNMQCYRRLAERSRMLQELCREYTVCEQRQRHIPHEFNQAVGL